MSARDPTTCKLSGSGSAFDGRGASAKDWELLRIVSRKVCSGGKGSKRLNLYSTKDFV